MKRPLTSRADLFRALAYDDPALNTAMAALLGYEYEDTPVVLPDVQSLPAQHEETSGAVDTTTAYQPAAVPFWRVEEFTAVAPVELPPPSTTLTIDDLVWRKRPTTIPGFTPLAAKREVLTDLRKIGATRRMTNDVDAEAVVERVSQGHFLHRIPHRYRRSWGSAITIVEDRARRLVPYWLDQDYVIDALKNLYPPNGMTIARLGDGDDQPVIRWPEEQRGQPIAPLPGTIVLVLGDLGCLARQGEYLRHFWLQYGRQLQAQGNPAVALVPAQTTDIPPDLAHTWTIVRWGVTATASTGSLVQAKANAVRQLLILLSPAVRIEPGLLRAVRGVFPEGRNDPGLEAHVWQDAAIASQHSVAASWDPEQRKTYKERFATQPEELRQVVLDLIRTWRTTLHHAVWFEEIVELDGQSQRGGIEPTDLEDAVTFFSVFAETLNRQSQQGSVDTKAWISRLTERYAPVAGSDPQVQHALHRLYDVIRPQSAEAQVPGWYDPAFVSAPGQTVRQVAVWQVADQLLVRTIEVPSRADPDSAVRGSPLGIVHTASGEVKVAVGELPPEKNDFWHSRRPPSWARDWGWDDFGPWVTFRVDDIEQRLRWMRPGHFLMGPPENEEGRFEDEGPRHEVLLSRGFWLFDTPCTQVLWQGVMETNPSEFKGMNRPVEQVSWQDCQEFIAKLNEQLPGLVLKLPTEAQWEYACRAGTTTVRYAEDLDAIAWYGKNSSDETHEVKQKQPNAWGLYDMLGNVAEWCHDGIRQYTKARQVDPLGPTEAGANRAVRGSNWGWNAWSVRAAYRVVHSPVYRSGNLGFRCASSSEHQPVQENSTWRVAQQQAELTEPAPRRSDARILDLNQQSLIAIAMPHEAALVMNTDRDRLRFGRITLPEWASEIGRDAYGLWVEFEVDKVRQRMRWIPPGRFWMGSPEDEEGRYRNEGPRHEVRLTHGFWLFDTPCTQALWQVVIGKNPSHFKGNEGKERPVEQVSWEDCQKFISALNARLPGVALALPTEAEWEYACRAGTDTPRYEDDLNAIAWYSENSNNQTHEVKRKRPNAWGLYDMLGNVDEWCHDGPRDYKAEVMVDPLGPTKASARRTIRGGCWFRSALFVRAAYRGVPHPDLRYDSLGFRLRVPVKQAGQ